jgi:hypothetical protein
MISQIHAAVGHFVQYIEVYILNGWLGFSPKRSPHAPVKAINEQTVTAQHRQVTVNGFL